MGAVQSCTRATAPSANPRHLACGYVKLGVVTAKTLPGQSLGNAAASGVQRIDIPSHGAFTVGFADVAGKVAAQIEKQARVLVDVAGAIILGSAGLSGINLARRRALLTFQ